MYVPDGVDDWVNTVSVEFPDPPAMVALERDTVGPVDGETVVARFTVPVKPFSGATVRVEAPVALGRIEREFGLAPSAKSGVAAVET